MTKNKNDKTVNVLNTWFLVNNHFVDHLEDHHWYLIIDPEFETPMKAKWHSDTYNFTYDFRGERLGAIHISHVIAYMHLSDSKKIVDELKKGE